MHRKVSRAWLSFIVIFCLTAVALRAPLLAVEKKTGQGKVNINQASADQLTTLPGIGPAMAKRIIEHRTKNGPFKKTEDLMSVKGIGQKKFSVLKDRITI